MKRLKFDENEFRKHLPEIAAAYFDQRDILVADEDMERIRRACRRLEPNERNLLLMYAESGSYRKVGQMLGFSRQTIALELKKIRKKIYADLKLHR